MFCSMLASAILAPRRSGCHANHRKCRHGRDVAQHLWRWGLGSESASPPPPSSSPIVRFQAVLLMRAVDSFSAPPRLRNHPPAISPLGKFSLFYQLSVGSAASLPLSSATARRLFN